MATGGSWKLPIRARLALWYTVLLVITVGALGMFLLTVLENNLLDEVDDGLSLRASHVEGAIASSDRRAGAEEVSPSLLATAPLDEFAAPGIYVQFFDREARLLASSPNLPGTQLPVGEEVFREALAGRETYDTVPAGRERVRLLARPARIGADIVGVILVGESLHPLDTMLLRTRQLVILGAVSAAILALASGWWVTTRGLGPIADMTRVARRIAATARFEQRIAQPQTRDEVAELAATFNEMLATLEKTFTRQREFLADASHELRGPLMVIQGNLSLLKTGIPEKDRLECIREANEEVERMSRLVSDLLFLAEVDTQEVVQHRPVELHEVVRDVWARAGILTDSSHEMVMARNDPATVLGDRDRLGQMIWNLLQNAVRYTPEGGQVTLTLLNHGSVAELIVADTGIGISAEHLPRIFDRFYRIDEARSPDIASTGLGLAIVKQVAEAHGGQVRVLSEPGHGTTFTVVIPIYQA